MQALALKSTFTFDGASFGFGSIITLSPDGQWGYVSSSGTEKCSSSACRPEQVSGRLKGLQTPAQITVTPDGATLLVVDVTAVELVIADAGSMTRKSAIKPTDTVSTRDPEHVQQGSAGSHGHVCDPSRYGVAGGSGYSGSILVFKVPSGEILFSGTIGSEPGFTGLRPNGQDWVILNESSISLVTCNDPGGQAGNHNRPGIPIGLGEHSVLAGLDVMPTTSLRPRTWFFSMTSRPRE